MPPEGRVATFGNVVDVDEGSEVVDLPADRLVVGLPARIQPPDQRFQMVLREQEHLNNGPMDRCRLQGLEKALCKARGQTIPDPGPVNPTRIDPYVVARLDAPAKRVLDFGLCLFGRQEQIGIHVAAAHSRLRRDLPHPSRAHRPRQSVGRNVAVGIMGKPERHRPVDRENEYSISHPERKVTSTDAWWW